MQNFYDESRKEYRSLCDEHEREQRALQEHKSFVEERQRKVEKEELRLIEEKLQREITSAKGPVALVGCIIILMAGITGDLGVGFLGTIMGGSLILFAIFAK